MALATSLNTVAALIAHLQAFDPELPVLLGGLREPMTAPVGVPRLCWVTEEAAAGMDTQYQAVWLAPVEMEKASAPSADRASVPQRAWFETEEDYRYAFTAWVMGQGLAVSETRLMARMDALEARLKDLEERIL